MIYWLLGSLTILFGILQMVPERLQGELSWEPCTVRIQGERISAICTTISVPENRSNPQSRMISLPIMRLQATQATTEPPIYYLAGGPGMSNLGFRPPLRLLEKHDVVLVGYRGVDGELVLNCPEVETAVLGVGNDLFSEASQQGMRVAIAACGERLRSEGVDLDGYTILETVADFEAARALMGDETIHLLSESYGTRLAQIFAQQFPERVSRSVMIGVNPPGRFVWEPEMIDAQLAIYAERCAEDERCRQKTADLAETMRTVNQTMPSRWLFFPINPGKVNASTFALLFNRSTAALAIDAYLAAADGDVSGLAMLSLIYDFVFPRLTIWGEFLAKGFSADFDPSRDYDTLNDPNSIMGSPIAQLVWPSAAGWPMKTIEEAYRTPQPSAVETLLISGNLDFSTPAPYATNDLLPTLANGRQLILSDMGHTTDFWRQQPEAAVELLRDFFATGVVDETLFVHEPMRFDTGFWSLPRLAKLLLGTPLLLLTVAAGFIARWRLRRARQG